MFWRKLPPTFHSLIFKHYQETTSESYWHCFTFLSCSSITIKGGDHKGQEGRKRRFLASRTSNLKPSSIFLGLQICISLSNGSIIFILNYINLCLSLEHTRRQKMSRELQFKNYFISLGIGIFYWNKTPHIFNHSHTDLVRYTFNYSPLSAYFIGDWILLPAEAVRVRKKLPNQYPPSDSLLIFVSD